MTYATNSFLTSTLRDRVDAGQSDSPNVGPQIGEGMYSVAYSGDVKSQPRLLRFFKLLGPDDRLEFKRRNIEAEITALRQLTEAGVGTVLHSIGTDLRNIHYTGPQKNGTLAFWEQDPVVYDGKTFVAYQICDYIDGLSADQIHEQREDNVFVEKFGRNFGLTLATFHHAAREVGFPFHQTEEQLRSYDHAYRLAAKACDATAKAAELFPRRMFHADLAAKLAKETLPLFLPNAPKDHWHPVHGDLGLGNIITQDDNIAGIVDWDKARIGFKESDFRGIADIPGALNAAADSYELTMRELTGRDVIVDRALVCKVALSIHLFNANDPKNLPRTDGGATINRDAAEQLVAIDIVLKQLADYDSSYEHFLRACERQAQRALIIHPGAHLTLR